jgi:hypothetical protein
MLNYSVILNFQEKVFHNSFIFTQNIKKWTKILGEKYKHFRRHLEYSHYFDFSLGLSFLPQR